MYKISYSPQYNFPVFLSAVCAMLAYNTITYDVDDDYDDDHVF
jgi:hypothetical protein